MSKNSFFFCLVLMIYGLTYASAENVATKKESTSAENVLTTAENTSSRLPENNQPAWILSSRLQYANIITQVVGASMDLRLPGRGDLGWGISLFKPLASSGMWQIHWDEAHLTQNVSAAPYRATVSKKDVIALAQFFNQEADSMGCSSYYLGYRNLYSGGAITSPFNLVTDLVITGILLGYGTQNHLPSLWKIQWDFFLFFPHLFREGPQNTGFNPRAIGIRWQTLAEVPVTERIFFQVGFTLDYLSISYSGTGSRGTQNAIDQRLIWQAPIGLIVHF